MVRVFYVCIQQMANAPPRSALEMLLRRSTPAGRNEWMRLIHRGPLTRRYTRNNAASVIQAHLRGMQTRRRLANPHTNIGRRAIMARFPGSLTHSPNRASIGARIRAGIRYGPERRISGRHPRGTLTPLLCGNYGCGLSGRRRSPQRRRSPPRRRSPGRNNNNLYY